LYNLMEDAATAEICRAQLWQCVHHGLRTNDGQDIGERFDAFLAEELDRIAAELGDERFSSGHFEAAASLFGDMVRKDKFDEFLTLPAYEQLA
jgi:malate synthase